MLYSGYVFLPKENKWKLIATCKIQGRWNSIQKPSVFYTTGKKNKVNAVFSQAWVQRNTGSWKNMLDNKSSNPVINLASHLDSLTRHAAEISIIKAAIEKGLTETKENKDDVFYKIILQGTGQQVNITDTVTVFYKGTLFGTGEIFDQTRDKPATFPLNRLIRGWQIGVPLCKVGATIKLVIPSALAYSIRTRASKIPPNSILVFEVEIVDMKAAN
ncbi:MAG: FKBP-type peptidyl-prolyl cis-trans isomerase [Chitinophagaceae bacterium]|nr:FKBP-type peptidyl-prolyl cis-trans isomerase [Chitinophagaceae bacterium]